MLHSRKKAIFESIPKYRDYQFHRITGALLIPFDISTQ